MVMGTYKRGQRFEPPYGDARKTLKNLVRQEESVPSGRGAFKRGQGWHKGFGDNDMGREPIKPQGLDSGNGDTSI
jgi:hypothetical protein